jgi:hypothetical protein
MRLTAASSERFGDDLRGPKARLRCIGFLGAAPGMLVRCVAAEVPGQGTYDKPHQPPEQPPRDHLDALLLFD